METKLNKINQNIQDIIKETDIQGMEGLTNSLKHHFKVRGKMLRPLFMITVNEDLNGEFEYIERFATSLELIHNYSLIHDDLPSMDNDDYRRGELTVHKKYGEDNAILSGDYLLTKSFEYLLEVNNNTKTYLKGIYELSKNASNQGMLGGQFLDLNVDYLDSKDNIEKMYLLKTSALFVSSFAIPGIINDLSENDINILRKIGKDFGLLFQIFDDLSDIEEDENTGKITILKYLKDDSLEKEIHSLKNSLHENLEKLNLIKTKEIIDKLYNEKTS